MIRNKRTMTDQFFQPNVTLLRSKHGIHAQRIFDTIETFVKSGGQKFVFSL